MSSGYSVFRRTNYTCGNREFVGNVTCCNLKKIRKIKDLFVGAAGEESCPDVAIRMTVHVHVCSQEGCTYMYMTVHVHDCTVVCKECSECCGDRA